MHILFIGGTGNISTDCAALLHKQGHTISVVTRGNKAVPTAYQTIIADRNDTNAFVSALSGVTPDVVIDFLTYTPEQLEINRKAFAGRVKQMIFISSATVYAKPHTLPVTEDAPLGNQWSDYARSKQACEEWLAAHGKELPYTIVRPSHTYSESWIPNIVTSAGWTFAQRLLDHKPVFVAGDGQSLWTLTTARDFAVGLTGLVENHSALGEAYHITNDMPLTWNQIYQEVARALGVDHVEIEAIPTDFICTVDPDREGGIKGDKAHSAVFDNAKIKAAVPNFECRDSIRTGLKNAVQWFEKHPNQKTIDPKIDAVWDRIIEAWRSR